MYDPKNPAVDTAEELPKINEEHPAKDDDENDVTEEDDE